VEIQGLTEEYQSKTDEELLRLALDAADLTPEANVVLNNELSRRRVNSPERLAAFRVEEDQRREEERKEAGSLFVLHPYGFGRDRFGKADRVYDPTARLERFKTTVFVVLIWFPLIPTGTFLVEKKRSLFSRQVTILRRLPLDWEQVLFVWVVATTILLAIFLAFRFFPYLLL
jgi:hypothetical protein